MSRNKVIVFLVILLFALAACGGGDEIDTSSFKEATSAELGLTIRYPEDWVTKSEGADIQLATTQELFDDPEKVEEGALVIITGFDQGTAGLLSEDEFEPGDAVALLNIFSELILSEDDSVTVREAPKVATYNEHGAAVMTVTATNEQDEELYGILVAMPNEHVVAYIFALTPAAQEEENQPLFDAMLNTIELSEPTMEELDLFGDSEEVAEVEEPEPTNEPEPTDEPEPTPVPEPTATPEPTPEPTAEPTPDVAAGFVDGNNEALGVAFQYPAEWVLDVDEAAGQLTVTTSEGLMDQQSFTEGAGVLMLSLDAELAAFFAPEGSDPTDPTALTEAFIGIFTGEGEDDTEITVRQETMATTINGQTAATAVVELANEDGQGIISFNTIMGEGRIVIAVGVVALDEEAELKPFVDAIINSITVSAGSAAAVPPVPAEPIRQWGSSANATSQYGDDSWSAQQATGAPDTLECGDITTAWASSDSDGFDWVDVYYDTPVYATEINIFETYNPDQVVLVDVIDMEGNYVTIYEGVATATECPYTLSITFDQTDFLVQGVSVTIDQSILGLGWNEIDAVELVGVPEGSSTSSSTTTTPPSPPVTLGDLPDVELETGFTMYSNANEVNDIVYHNGFIFAATDGGMVVWNATSGELMGKRTTLDGLGSNVADAITVCPIPNPRVIIGTDQGITIYDPSNDIFEENWTPDNSGMSSDFGVDTLTCVPQLNTLVVGYDVDGVDVYDANSGNWTYYAPFDDLESGFAQSIAVKGDLDEIWVAHIAAVSRISSDGTITYFDDENSNLDDAGTDNFEHFVNDIVIDDNGTVWFAQSAGLTRVNGENDFTFFNGDDIEGWPFFNSVESVAVGPDGTLWTNTAFGGICQFDPATATCLTSFEDESGMAEDFNNTLIVNDDGSLYYGSDGEGVSVYDGSSWTSLQVDELAESNAYSAIAHGADGSIWVGGSYGGNRFFAYDANSAWESLDDVLGFNSVSTFYGTADGMWIGHSDGAVFYEYATGSWTEVERADEAGQGIYDGGATAIAMDAKGNMWFGTYSGLTMWDGSSFTYFDLLDDAERTDGRYPRNVYSLLAVGDSVWVATSGVIFRFDNGTEAARFNEGAGDMPFFFTAYSLAQDADGNVLAGVNDTLMQYNGSGWDEVQEFDRDVRSILLTPDGVLFIGLSGAGVVSNLQGDWETVTTADGLPSNSFSGQQSIAIDYLGSMWFAASEGGILRWVP